MQCCAGKQKTKKSIVANVLYLRRLQLRTAQTATYRAMGFCILFNTKALFYIFLAVFLFLLLSNGVFLSCEKRIWAVGEGCWRNRFLCSCLPLCVTPWWPPNHSSLSNISLLCKHLYKHFSCLEYYTFLEKNTPFPKKFIIPHCPQ